MNFLTKVIFRGGHVVVQLVVALRYKPEGRGFDFRWGHWDSSLTLSFRPSYGPGSTQRYLVEE